ncbi:GAF domain-containing protein [Streptomyces sp. NPDC006879]|uniref:GAF domain-containing protein n=1 Tax=Streptomyces sp. NPDC006879 TaxID=3364767 RepID=UPI00369FFB5B
MSGTWLALPSGADAAERRRVLQHAHQVFTTEGRLAPPVRPVVADSWRRCARARVDPDAVARMTHGDEDVAAYRAGHPLARVMPLFRDLMGTFAEDGDHLIAVCDAGGRLMWVEGHHSTRRAAGRLGFVPGAHWAESEMGTNAPGTAVAVDRPVQVFAAEHFSRPVHPWTCAAAPVHDPRDGKLLGAVDITGGDQLAHPHSLAFVRAVARAAESELALIPADPAPAQVRLTVLGRDEAIVGSAGSPVRLSRRHSEIALLLSQHPEGLTGDQLHISLYEDESVSPVTLRAEMSRLRRLLGSEVLHSRPYRFCPSVESDYATVRGHLAAGRSTAALSAYCGPLLPGSDAPEVVRLRHDLSNQLRACLIEQGDHRALSTWANSTWGGQDLPVWHALARSLPGEGRAAALARVRELDLAQGGPSPDPQQLCRRVPLA